MIRPIQVGDEQSVLSLVKLSFSSAIMETVWMGASDSERMMKEQIKHRVNPLRFVYVVDQIVGYIEGVVIHQVLHVNYLCVHPSFRNHGIGKKLLKHIGRKNSEKWMELNVFQDNHIAYHLYKRLGFIDESRVKWIKKEIYIPEREKKRENESSYYPIFIDFMGEKLKMMCINGQVIRTNNVFFLTEVNGNSFEHQPVAQNLTVIGIVTEEVADRLIESKNYQSMGSSIKMKVPLERLVGVKEENENFICDDH